MLVIPTMSKPVIVNPTFAERLLARADVIVLSALLSAGAFVIYFVGRGLNFFYDEWDFILGRRGNSIDSFLESHGGHLVVVPVLIYKTLFAIVGLEHYGPYRLTDLALHLLCVILLFVLVRRRVGGAVAVIAAASLLFLGGAWQDLLWAFQITYLGSIAAVSAPSSRSSAATSEATSLPHCFSGSRCPAQGSDCRF